MIKQPTKTNTFKYAPEIRQNPYTGFMSFQHFRGDPIYSDCIVKPENNMCETENYEPYPVPAGVEEKGYDEGYYPEDVPIAYIRFLWKEFEPERGKYNYKFIQDILDKAIERDQVVIFRFMAHSTRWQDDVPEWLKSIVECPERPTGKRVKDSPTDPKFIELFLEAVKKFGERFDGAKGFYAMDISLPGAWGEGHKLELFPDNILEVIVDVYTSVFKKTRLFGQVGRPELLKYANEKIMTGWRGDGFGDPFHIDESYPPKIEKVKDMWKTVPVSFESYWWLGEWKRQGWDIDVLIDRSLKWHLSSFNAKSLPVPFEWKEKVEAWIRKMGYHYMIESVAYPEEAMPCEKINITLCVDNIGVAPMYVLIPLHIKLKSADAEYTFKCDVDLTKWLPGKHKGNICIQLPEDIAKGEYDLEAGLLGDDGMRAYFCTDAEYDNGFYKLGRIEIK